MRSSILVLFLLIVSPFGIAFSSNLPDGKNLTSSVVLKKCNVRSLENDFRASAAVFTGKVVKEEKVGDTRVFEFEVEKYWKGTVGKQIKVGFYETVRYQAWLKVGENYLIFATGDEDGQLYIERCSRARSLGTAGVDVRKLGAAKRPN